MNRDTIQGDWEQLKGHVQKQWGKLTDNDLDIAEGNRKILVGRIQERYGKTKEAAEREVEDFYTKVHADENDDINSTDSRLRH